MSFALDGILIGSGDQRFLARVVILLVRFRGDRWQVVGSSPCPDRRKKQAQPSTTDGSGTRSRANHWKVVQPNDSGPRLRATCLAVSSLMGWGSTALT